MQAKRLENVVYKTRGVSIGHVRQKNTNDECEHTQVKHTYNLRNKIQHAAVVNEYISVSVSACLRNLSNDVKYNPDAILLLHECYC